MPSKEFTVYLPQEKGVCPRHVGPREEQPVRSGSRARGKRGPEPFRFPLLCSGKGKAGQGRKLRIG